MAEQLPTLLPCPFCGGAAHAYSEGDRGYFRVSCQNAVSCGHRGSPLVNRSEAVSAWNRRVDLSGQGLVATEAIHWRCFHCNFVAQSHEEAVAHFGSVMNERPALCLTGRGDCKYVIAAGKLCPKCGHIHAPAQSALDELRREVQALRPDAERWRKMRALILASNVTGEYGLDYLGRRPCKDGIGSYVWKTTKTIDAAIDTARASTDEGVGK